MEIKKILQRVLNGITSSENTNVLLEYFDGIITKEELLKKYTSINISVSRASENLIETLFDEIKNNNIEKKIYEILFIAKDNFLFNNLKSKYKDRIEYYKSLRNDYNIDLEFVTIFQVQYTVVNSHYKDFLAKNLLWEMVDMDSVITKLPNDNSKVTAILYLLANKKVNEKEKKIEYLNFLEEKILDFFDKFVFSSIKIPVKNKFIDYINGKQELSIQDLYYLLEKNLLNNNYLNYIEKIIAVCYEELECVKRITILFAINDHISKKPFTTVKYMIRNYSPEKKVEFSVDFFKNINAPDVFTLELFLKYSPSTARKNWLISYLKNNFLKEILSENGEKQFIFIKEKNKQFRSLFDQLSFSAKENLNDLYKELTGEYYTNIFIEEFEKNYCNYLKNNANIDEEEIEKIIKFFHGKINITELKKQSHISGNDFYLYYNEYLKKLKTNEYEYFKKFIEYEYKKTNKNMRDISSLSSYNHFDHLLEILSDFDFSEKELCNIGFEYFEQSFNDNPNWIKKFNSDTFYETLTQRINNLNPTNKKLIFENFFESNREFEIYFDNLKSNKELKEILIQKSEKLDRQSVIKFLKEKLTDKSSKNRENSIDILFKLDTENLEELLKKVLEKERSNKIKEKINDYLTKLSPLKQGKNKGLKSYLNLLTLSNKRKFNKLKSEISLLEDQENKELPIEYSMLLISFFINNDIDKAIELQNEVTNYIDKNSITKLADNIYLWSKSNNFDTKYKEITYFSIVNSSGLIVEQIKKDIENLAKNMRNMMAANFIKVLSYNKDDSILLFLDYASTKIKRIQVKNAVLDSLKIAAKTRNITLEELKDKIISNFGLDIYGSKIYSYGSREFKITLLPKCEFKIVDLDTNKSFKNLPKPGKNDETETAEISKKEFQALKKQIKNNYKLQIERMEIALIDKRTWKKDMFEEIFIKNPVMREFGTGLVWGIYNDGKLSKSFRVTEDGSLITFNEEEFKFSDNDKISLVHPIELEEKIINLWKEQFEDYELHQPFDQLNRKIYKEEEKFTLGIANPSRLSNKLLKQRWERGEVMDGGFFYEFYYKNLTNNILVVLEHSGMPVNWYSSLSIDIKELNFYNFDDELDNMDKIFYNSKTFENAKLKFEEIPKRFYSEIIKQLDELIE